MFEDDEFDEEEGEQDEPEEDDDEPDRLRAELAQCRKELTVVDDARALRKWRSGCEFWFRDGSITAARRMMYSSLLDAIDDRLAALQVSAAAKSTKEDAEFEHARARQYAAQDRLELDFDLARVKRRRAIEYQRFVERYYPQKVWDIQRMIVEIHDDRILALSKGLLPPRNPPPVEVSAPEAPVPAAAAESVCAEDPGLCEDARADAVPAPPPIVRRDDGPKLAALAGGERDAELLALVASRGRVSSRDVQTLLGWSRSTTRDVLARLVDDGRLLPTAVDPRSPSQAYVLT